TDHSYLELNDEKFYFHGGATTSEVFSLMLGNMLLIIFTLGIGTPWAIVRSVKFTLQNTMLHGAFDPTAIEQTEPEFNDATGDMLLDALDLDL
ncbi:MAG: YjgN family protein, partial [Bacteroidia bacterium]|nr:YjgN family protein [Bacteroidia bacterium]